MSSNISLYPYSWRTKLIKNSSNNINNYKCWRQDTAAWIFRSTRYIHLVSHEQILVVTVIVTIIDQSPSVWELSSYASKNCLDRSLNILTSFRYHSRKHQIYFSKEIIRMNICFIMMHNETKHFLWELVLEFFAFEGKSQFRIVYFSFNVSMTSYCSHFLSSIVHLRAIWSSS